MEFKIETKARPSHQFSKEKIYFPFDKLEAPKGDDCQGFDVPIEFKSRANYQLNAVIRDKSGTITKKVGLNKSQSEKEYRMTKSVKGDGYFTVVRVK